MDRIFPKIEQGQFAVARADSNTGHILTVNNKISLSPEDEVIEIFQNIEEAYRYIQDLKLSQTSIEFLIYNWKHEFVEFIKAG